GSRTPAGCTSPCPAGTPPRRPGGTGSWAAGAPRLRRPGVRAQTCPWGRWGQGAAASPGPASARPALYPRREDRTSAAATGRCRERRTLGARGTTEVTGRRVLRGSPPWERPVRTAATAPTAPPEDPRGARHRPRPLRGRPP